MLPPGAAAARREARLGIVAVKTIGEQDAVGRLLHAGRDQQIDIADIAHARVGIDALRQRNALEHPNRNSRLLQQIAETPRLGEIAECAQRIFRWRQLLMSPESTPARRGSRG